MIAEDPSHKPKVTVHSEEERRLKAAALSLLDSVGLADRASADAGDLSFGELRYVGAQAEYKYQPGHTFGSSNPYVLASTKNNSETVIYQPTTGAAS